MREQVTKAEFKKLYMKHRTVGDGWSDDYWEHFYAPRDDTSRFFFTAPETPRHDRMFISSDPVSVHLFFMTSESEDSLFDYPGKE